MADDMYKIEATITAVLSNGSHPVTEKQVPFYLEAKSQQSAYEAADEILMAAFYLGTDCCSEGPEVRLNIQVNKVVAVKPPERVEDARMKVLDRHLNGLSCEDDKFDQAVDDLIVAAIAYGKDLRLAELNPTEDFTEMVRTLGPIPHIVDEGGWG